MPSFLSIPVEIRLKILHYAADTEIHVCGNELGDCEIVQRAPHKPLLVDPNLNLRLVCRQLSYDFSRLKIRYTLGMSRMCILEIYTLLSPNRRQQCTFVISPWIYEPIYQERSYVIEKHPSARFDPDLLIRDLEPLRPGANFTFKTVHWEYAGVKHKWGQDSALYDLTYTF
jgi:hypothetical protein